jgi:hypothetical protein
MAGGALSAFHATVTRRLSHPFDPGIRPRGGPMVGCHSFLSGHNSLREAHFHWDPGGCMVGLPTAKGVHVQESKK